MVNFYNGSNARPVQVRVLLFNDAFNIYEKETDNFIASFPIKGATVNETGKNYFVYSPDQRLYFQLNTADPLVEQIAREVKNKDRNVVSRLLRHRAFTLLIIALALIVGLYFSIISLVPYLGSKMIDETTEIKIGSRLRELMMQQEAAMGAHVDSAGTQQLQQFAGKLTLSSRYPIRVTLVKSNTVNAYALPGGEIVVYSGILEKMDSYESLVALLAHESSHVNERHTLRSLLRSAANSIIISIVFGDVTGTSGALAGNIENLNGLHYSRSLEREADNEGMQLMLANNVDISGMKQLMELLKKEGDMPGSLAFLSTHPLTTERVTAAEDFIRSHKNTSTEREDLKTIFQSLQHSK